MELKVGMYIRTKDGNISKIKDINNFIYTDKQRYGKHYIEKASENIIDLIKVGDYVNGYKIEEVNNNLNEHEGICNCLDTYLWRVNDLEIFEEIVIFENDIKSVVTKEQFESIKYIVEK